MACIIGEINDWENTRLVTVASLVEHIKENLKHERFRVEVCKCEPRQVYTLKEYGDMRYNSDLTRFHYCPMCGARIDWKQIKDMEVDYGIH